MEIHPVITSSEKYKDVSFDVSTNNGIKIDPACKKTIDTGIRYSMVIMGMLSGPASMLSHKWLRRLSSFYHFAVCCVMTANLGITLNKQIPIGYVNTTATLSSLAALIFLLQCTFCSWYLFGLSHHKAGLSIYYTNLQKLLCLCGRMQQKIESTKFRVVHSGILIAGWLLGLMALGFQLYWLMYMTGATETGKLILPPIDVFAATVVYWSLFHWTMQTAYIATISFTLWQIANAFQAVLTENIKSSPNLVLQNIYFYRQIHLQWCRLVATASRCLRHILAITLGCSMGACLIVLYIMANMKLSGNAGEAAALLQGSYYVMANIGSIMVVVFFAEKVGAAVSTTTICSVLSQYNAKISSSIQCQINKSAGCKIQDKNHSFSFE